jgi:protein-tyrosine phosphatase
MINVLKKKIILILMLLFFKIFNLNNYDEIIPNIYIGNIWSSFINHKDFDVVVNLTKDLGFSPNCNNIHFRIPVDDNYIFKNQDITNYFSIIDKLIELYKNNKKILIHCRFGIQRSAFFTQILIMKLLNLTKLESYHLIKSKRKICFLPYHNFNHISF